MLSPSPLEFDRDFAPHTGTLMPVAVNIDRLTAPNANPYTFTGTNTYLLGDTNLVIVDPGPDDTTHFEALITAINARPVAAILLTHTHKDHSALAARLGIHTNAPIWFGGSHRLSRPKKPFEINPIAKSSDWNLRPDRTLKDGEILQFGEIYLKTIATPGHCANHFAFALMDSAYILTGDHVMGWNSTLVAPPDGSMADYFTSLDKLIAAGWSHYLPAHGGPIDDGVRYTKNLKAHRNMRNQQILDALRNAPLSLGQLCAGIYPDLPVKTRMAARMTVQAHLEYLQQNNRIISIWSLGGQRFKLKA